MCLTPRCGRVAGWLGGEQGGWGQGEWAAMQVGGKAGGRQGGWRAGPGAGQVWRGGMISLVVVWPPALAIVRALMATGTPSTRIGLDGGLGKRHGEAFRHGSIALGIRGAVTKRSCVGSVCQGATTQGGVTPQMPLQGSAAELICCSCCCCCLFCCCF